VKRLKICIALSLVFLALKSTGQEIPAIHYTMKDGLGGSSVAGIYQDRKGHMWFVTLGGGLSRFDGRKFNNYGLQQGLEVELVRSITETTNGLLYVGTFGAGVYYLQSDSLIRVFSDTLPKEIFTLAADQYGAVYVGGETGLFKLLPNNTIVNLTAELNLIEGPVTHIAIDKKGDVWFNYDEFMGVYHLAADTLTYHYDSLSGLTQGRILSTFHDSKSNTWISTHTGLYRINKTSHKCEKITAEGLPDYYLFDIVELPNGDLIIGTQDRGVVFYNPSKNKVTRAYDSNHGLKNQIAFKVFLDRENNVWVSSWGEGVSRLLLTGWEKYGEGSGFSQRLIYDIIPYHKAWLIATPNGLYLQEEKKRAEPFLPELINESVLMLRHSGEELFCAKERSLEIINLNTKQVATYADSKAQGIKSCAQTKDGTLYFASWGGGITTYVNGMFSPVEDTLAQSVSYLYCAYTDQKGELWLGTWEAGLLNFDGENWKRLSTEAGLPSDKVTCITEDSRGRIIAGTNGGGIAILDGDKITVLNSASAGLPNNSVFSLHCTPKDQLWIGFQGSVGVYDLNTQHLTIYDEKTGFEGDVMLNAMAASNTGVWVGTNNYLWHFEHDKQVPSRTSLRVFFNSIVVNGSLAGHKHEFRYDENKFHISFYSTQLFRAEEVKFQYRLFGIDEDFGEPTSQTEVSLLELPHGNYTFEVRACLDGECGESVVYSFTIHPPFWKTWWFISLVVVLLVVLIWTYIQWRERKLKETQRILEETVTERTKEIAHQKEIVEERNKEITDSINYAKRLQDAILPPTKLWYDALPASFILYLPKDIVAGDFYWMHTAEEAEHQTIWIAAADCTGHGVPGAMVSVVCSNALNRAVKEFGMSTPDSILNKVRELVIETFEKSENQVLDGMDISLARLVVKKSTSAAVFNQISWAGANNPLWILRKNAAEVEEIKADKQPVGNYGEQKPFTLHEITLEKDDSIYLFSDGYQDQFGGEKGKKFKAAELKKLLLSIQEKSMTEQCNTIKAVFEQWRGNLEQVDDVCIIGVRIS
jgi:ligand-binding sensor domain-containing protein/serine phosphatase RsbU (regulator of sigma subunit)